MKYRKKPVEVEAFQFYYDAPRFPAWAEDAFTRRAIEVDYLGDWYINTLEGRMHVSDGDYIIKGVKGELYACKPDIFDETYEIAEWR